MTHHLQPHRIGPVLVALVAVAVLVTGGSPATAGGWALGSLDSLPTATAGDTAEVGFTVLQHGISPAELSGDAGIEIVGEDGTTVFFPATPDGSPGHYVSNVTFPESGTYTWAIRMGWLGLQDLGTLDVVPSAGAASGPVWPTARWGLLALTTVLAAVALSDLWVDRRRGRVVLG